MDDEFLLGILLIIVIAFALFLLICPILIYLKLCKCTSLLENILIEEKSRNISKMQ